MNAVEHQAPPLRTVRVPGPPRIALDHAGSGPLLLFLHGIGGNRTNWLRQIEHFSPSYHAAAWDLRGYGLSDDYDGPLRFEDIRADLHRVLDHFEASACHLVGLSLGGRIGFDFVRHAPERVLSFTACSAVADAADMPPQDRARFLELRKAPLLAGKTPADIAPTVARSLAGPNCSAQAMDELVASICALRAGSYIKTLDAASSRALPVPLGEIRVPTHLMAAQCDPLFPIGKIREIACAIPGAHLTILPGVGHLSNLEEPLQFNRALMGFLQDVQQRQPAPSPGAHG